MIHIVKLYSKQTKFGHVVENPQIHVSHSLAEKTHAVASLPKVKLRSKPELRPHNLTEQSKDADATKRLHGENVHEMIESEWERNECKGCWVWRESHNRRILSVPDDANERPEGDTSQERVVEEGGIENVWMMVPLRRSHTRRPA